MNTPIFEENGLENFKGIDIMRAVRSFDPCLPCGVHMYLGEGKVLKKMHSPTQVARPRRWPVRRPCTATLPRPHATSATGSSGCSTSCSSRLDPRAYERSRSSCGCVTELYGAGLARIVDLVGRGVARAARPPRRRRAGRQPADRPRAPPRRPRPGGSRPALESVRPFLAHHDGDVELLDVDADAGAVQLRLLGSCDGCPSSSVTLQARRRAGHRRGRPGDRPHRRRRRRSRAAWSPAR